MYIVELKDITPHEKTIWKRLQIASQDSPIVRMRADYQSVEFNVVLLRTVSDVLNAMFNANMRESATRIIELPEIRATALNTFQRALTTSATVYIRDTQDAIEYVDLLRYLMVPFRVFVAFEPATTIDQLVAYLETFGTSLAIGNPASWTHAVKALIYQDMDLGDQHMARLEKLRIGAINPVDIYQGDVWKDVGICTNGTPLLFWHMVRRLNETHTPPCSFKVTRRVLVYDEEIPSLHRMVRALPSEHALGSMTIDDEVPELVDYEGQWET